MHGCSPRRHQLTRAWRTFICFGSRCSECREVSLFDLLRFPAALPVEKKRPRAPHGNPHDRTTSTKVQRNSHGSGLHQLNLSGGIALDHDRAIVIGDHHIKTKTSGACTPPQRLKSIVRWVSCTDRPTPGKPAPGCPRHRVQRFIYVHRGACGGICEPGLHYRRRWLDS